MQFTRYVGSDGSQNKAYLQALESPTALVIDSVSTTPNVSMHLRLDGKQLALDKLDADSRDLVDVGTAIFIADAISQRKNAPDSWTRSLRFLVPVAHPPNWSQATLTLADTMRFLSGDHWAFDWPKRDPLPPAPRHRAAFPDGVDVVCLFSGGVDSLLGANLLLAEGKRVLLVGHQSEGATAAAQERLVSVLRTRYPGSVWFLQAGIRRSLRGRPQFLLPRPLENTHRVRSFLFLSLAVAVARTLKVSQVYIPENGLIALNVPTQISRLGSCSTRTAHPRFLMGFQKVLAESGLYHGEIRNPFLYLSKTDMILDAPKELKALLRRSTSCARPNLHNHLGVSHCGYCTPCVFRRLAMSAAGLDNPTDYAFKIFEDPSHIRTEKGADIRALVGFATAIASASAAQLDALVLSHGFFPPSAGKDFGPKATESYAPWAEMLSRWAKQFIHTAADFHPDVRNALGVSSGKNQQSKRTRT